MIRLTILYNLPVGTDEAEFLRWRLGEHQATNESMPGVVHTDFGKLDESWTLENPRAPSPYRFMTTAEWTGRESFERGFYDPQIQAELKEDIKRIANPIFLISEILASST